MLNNLQHLDKQALYELLSSRFSKEEKKLSDIPNPALLHDGVKAAKRIAEAEYLAKQARIARRGALERKAEQFKEQAALAVREALDTDDGQPMVIQAFDAEAMQQFEQKALGLANTLSTLKTSGRA